MFTIQTLLQKKVFGNHLAGTKPLEYRRNEWQELNKGRERSVRLIVRAMLGVPSAHQSEQEHALWCFQFQTGSLLVVYLQRGTVIELAAKQEAEAEEDKDKEIEEAVDFLIEEVTTRLRQL
ncbi:MAG: hypothetical protein ACM3XM_08955 [Mycobacterium leprae]